MNQPLTGEDINLESSTKAGKGLQRISEMRSSCRIFVSSGIRVNGITNIIQINNMNYIIFIDMLLVIKLLNIYKVSYKNWL